LFIELTSDELLREWLPRLVGIESAVVVRLADGTEVRCRPEAGHAEQLTRDDITSSVHYVNWEFDAAVVAAFDAGTVTVAIDHPGYSHAVELGDATVAELVSDLRS
jgi:hypothetical protein